MKEWIGYKTKPFVSTYGWKDAALYALSIGAQTDELPFLYENTRGGMKVFPSFCVLSMNTLLMDLLAKLDLPRILHGEQLIRLHRPIPPEGRLRTVGEIPNVYDKGQGKPALICLRTDTALEGGEPLFTNEAVIFYRGAGGFGGEPGPKAEPLDPPRGVEPDFRISYALPENQAALYRLTGDVNPLHIDPEFAKKGGLDRPILHGLCSFGYATRAILYGACGGDAARFKELKVRFSGMVYPGETLTTEGWKDRDGRYLIQVRTERAVVMSQAYATVE
ncbi:MAG: MaoC/PaaZ C-terminal domain-containing protein [bacterium]